MRFFEGQAMGALIFLIGSMAVYGISFLIAMQPVRETSIPWGYQGTGVMAVEIIGNPRKEGIYFLPEGTTLGKLRELGVVPGMRNVGTFENARICAGSVLDISGNGEVKTGKMDAARELALGLPVNVNHASAGHLSLVPGIGDKMANQIVQLRKQKGAFRDLSELTAIPGIKERKLNGLKEYLIAGQVP